MIRIIKQGEAIVSATLIIQMFFALSLRVLSWVNFAFLEVVDEIFNLKEHPNQMTYNFICPSLM